MLCSSIHDLGQVTVGCPCMSPSKLGFACMQALCDLTAGVGLTVVWACYQHTCFTLGLSPLPYQEMHVVCLGAWKPPGRMQQDAPLPLSQDPCPNKLGAGTFCPARGTGWANGSLCKTSPCSNLPEQKETHPHFFHLFCQTTCAEPQLMQYNSHSFCNAELSSLTTNPLHRTRGQPGHLASRWRSYRRLPAMATLRQPCRPRLGHCYPLSHAAGSSTGQSMCCNINL